MSSRLLKLKKSQRIPERLRRKCHDLQASNAVQEGHLDDERKQIVDESVESF